MSIPAPFKGITSASIDHFHLIHWPHFSSWPHLTTREAGKFYSDQKLEVYSYGRRSVWMLGARSHLFHGSYVALRSISSSFLFLVTLSLFSILLLSCFLPLPSTPLPVAPLLCSRPHMPQFHIHNLILPSQPPCEGGINCTYMTDEDIVTQES